MHVFNDRNRYILSSLGALAGIILATSWPRFGWWIPIDWLATTNFRLGPECHSAGDMISSISYFMGLLCFAFNSVCFFKIRSLFIMLSPHVSCDMFWEMQSFNVLDCTAVKQLQALSLHTGSLRQKFTWACWKMEGIIPDGSCFFSGFKKKIIFLNNATPPK